MANFVPLAAASAIGLIGYVNWQHNPGNIYTDNSQVTGSSVDSKATKYPNVKTSAYDAPVLSGINSQVPNPKMKAPPARVPHTSGRTPYAVIEPNSSFEVKGMDTDIMDEFDQINSISREYLRQRPASVPFSPSKHFTGKKPIMVDVRGRSEQYMGAADTAQLASIPVMRPSGQKPMQHHMKLPTDYARATKSLHSGSLLPGTRPAYALDPQATMLGSPSAWTQIYTGRRTKVVY